MTLEEQLCAEYPKFSEWICLIPEDEVLPERSSLSNRKGKPFRIRITEDFARNPIDGRPVAAVQAIDIKNLFFLAAPDWLSAP